jgi:PTS system ascorbate-specific IIA component
MVGILIVAHGTLGESLIHCVSHVIGQRPPHLMQLGIGVHDDPQAILPQAIRLIRQLDQGDGVLVFSDIYGATPCNIASKLVMPGKVEGIAGVNLPMLVRALTYRNETLDVLVKKALSGGTEGIIPFTRGFQDAATGS